MPVEPLLARSGLRQGARNNIKPVCHREHYRLSGRDPPHQQFPDAGGGTGLKGFICCDRAAQNLVHIRSPISGGSLRQAAFRLP